jgi:hypothetical protein
VQRRCKGGSDAEVWQIAEVVQKLGCMSEVQGGAEEVQRCRGGAEVLVQVAGAEGAEEVQRYYRYRGGLEEVQRWCKGDAGAEVQRWCRDDADAEALQVQRWWRRGGADAVSVLRWCRCRGGAVEVAVQSRGAGEGGGAEAVQKRKCSCRGAEEVQRWR